MLVIYWLRWPLVVWSVTSGSGIGESAFCCGPSNVYVLPNKLYSLFTVNYDISNSFIIGVHGEPALPLMQNPFVGGGLGLTLIVANFGK